MMRVFPFDIPVNPDAPPAREWLIEELSKPQYQAAKPSLFDQIVSAIWKWITSLHVGAISGPPALGIAVLIGAIIAALVTTFVIFGVPRLNRASAVTGSLFGEDDARNAAAMRAAAVDAARQGDFTSGIVEMFRSIARGLAERTVLVTSPGTTARDFSVRAGLAFPESTEALTTAATAFDAVRYLGRRGDARQFEQLSTLERELRTTKPQREPALT